MDIAKSEQMRRAVSARIDDGTIELGARLDKRALAAEFGLVHSESWWRPLVEAGVLSNGTVVARPADIAALRRRLREGIARGLWAPANHAVVRYRAERVEWARRTQIVRGDLPYGAGAGTRQAGEHARRG